MIIVRHADTKKEIVQILCPHPVPIPINLMAAGRKGSILQFSKTTSILLPDNWPGELEIIECKNHPKAGVKNESSS